MKYGQTEFGEVSFPQSFGSFRGSVSSIYGHYRPQAGRTPRRTYKRCTFSYLQSALAKSGLSLTFLASGTILCGSIH